MSFERMDRNSPQFSSIPEDMQQKIIARQDETGKIPGVTGEYSNREVHGDHTTPDYRSGAWRAYSDEEMEAMQRARDEEAALQRLLEQEILNMRNDEAAAMNEQRGSMGGPAAGFPDWWGNNTQGSQYTPSFPVYEGAEASIPTNPQVQMLGNSGGKTSVSAPRALANALRASGGQ